MLDTGVMRSAYTVMPLRWAGQIVCAGGLEGWVECVSLPDLLKPAAALLHKCHKGRVYVPWQTWLRHW